MRLLETGRTVLTTGDTEVAQAQEFAGFFEDLLEGAPAGIAVRRDHEDVRSLPPELTQLLAHVVETVAKGGTVTIGTMPRELTTTTAAGLLGVSRPTLMKMVKRGEIPAHKVGSHTRLLAKDVLAAKDAQFAKQSQSFEELRALEDELGL